jgi:hypothetical protein
MAKGRMNEERFKNLYIVLIGIGFLVSGVGGMLRTVVINADLIHLNMNSTTVTHFHLDNAVLNVTLSIAILENALLIFIGLLLIFYDNILNFLVK